MIACAILSILLLLSVPFFQGSGHTIAWQVAEQLRSNIALAQLQSGTDHQLMRLCPSNDFIICQDHWHRDYLLMNVKNNLVLTVQQLPKNITLQYRGFPHSKWIEFSTLGRFLGNGTFSVLYRGQLYYQVIINHGGRVKIEAI